MTRLALLGFLIFISFGSRAGDTYPVGSIPPSLLQNANVVKRFESISFELVKPGEAIYRRKTVLTILNESGRKHAAIAIGYDRLRRITEFDGALYDGAGKLLRKAKNKDIQDYSAVQESSLFDDNRIKLLDFNYGSYPYTLEYEVEMRIGNSYAFMDWLPQPVEGLSVENSSYTLIVPGDYQPRFKAINYPAEPELMRGKNKNSFTWRIASLPAITKGFASPVWNELAVSVLFSPSGFEMEGYHGDASTWEGMGKFFGALNEGRDRLPAAVAQKVKELVSTAADDREKVEILYRFLQQNTRYISIQLGIGGLQPFDASFVAQKGYGDCKALSNYMYSLLKAAGIRSHYALVRAGGDAADRWLSEDFPSDRFNHVILCVPLNKDSLWLECTSQTEAAGYMGSFTGNRKALLVTEEGGRLVSTPRYGLNENRQVRKMTGSVRAEGQLDIRVDGSYSGWQQEKLDAVASQVSLANVKQYLQEELGFSNYDVNSFNYQEERSAVPLLKESLDLSIRNYATATGKRLFIRPNIFDGKVAGFPDVERRLDFVFDEAFRTEDHVEIEIPDGYAVESAPSELDLHTPYGSFRFSARLTGNKIVYTRVYEQYAGRFPASHHIAIKEFFDQIIRADRASIVLVKKG